MNSRREVIQSPRRRARAARPALLMTSSTMSDLSSLNRYAHTQLNRDVRQSGAPTNKAAKALEGITHKSNKEILERKVPKMERKVSTKMTGTRARHRSVAAGAEIGRECPAK